ncbi:MAG: hypothetical protein Q9171_001232 [Xanthocarpia ochracea]
MANVMGDVRTAVFQGKHWSLVINWSKRRFMEIDKSFSQIVSDSQFSVLGIALLAETARIQALLDPIQDSMKLPEHVIEGQKDLRTNPVQQPGPKEWEDVGRLVQRPASSTATPDLIAEDMSLNQATDRTAMRKITTAEDKRLRKPRKTIEELFRTLE